MTAADQELTGHRWHPSARLERHEYVGKRRILFTLGHDAHNGLIEAWQLPAFPVGIPRGPRLCAVYNSLDPPQ